MFLCLMAENITAVQFHFVLLFLFCLHTSVYCLHACFSPIAENNLTMRQSETIQIRSLHCQANSILFSDGQLQSRKQVSCVFSI